MGFLRVLRVCLCVLCVSIFALPVSALDRHAFTFTDYNLTVTITPASSSMDVSGKVTLRNDTAEAQKLAVLQISSSLDWKSITVGGKAVQYVSQTYTTDMDHTGALTEAIVTLPAAVAPKGTVEVEFRYSGTVTADATRLTRIGVPEKTALASDWDRIGDPFTAVRGVGYVAWYPIASEAASLSEGNEVFREIGAWKQREAGTRMQFSVVVKDKSVFSNLSSMADCFAAAGCFWSPGIGWRAPAFISGTYEQLVRRVLQISPGVQINYLAGRQELAEDYARVITDLAPFVSDWFGGPKQAVRFVELPWADVAPWESGPMLLTALKQENHAQLELTLVHQLTHAALESPRPWIYEGVAHFAQVLDRERVEGRKSAIAYMQVQSQTLLAAQQPSLPNAPGREEKTPPRRLEPLVTTADELFYRTKAMWVWWMLRDLVGEPALKQALRGYRAEEDREASYMQRLVESAAKRNLEWFFDDWVYRDRGLPEFQIESAYPRKMLNGNFLVTVTVENRGDAGAEVPVTVETSHGEVMKRLLVLARQKAVVRIEVPEAPKRVLVNDGSVPEVLQKDNSVEVR